MGKWVSSSLGQVHAIVFPGLEKHSNASIQGAAESNNQVEPQTEAVMIGGDFLPSPKVVAPGHELASQDVDFVDPIELNTN